jgi:anti-anti-sigma regulatory factor
MDFKSEIVGEVAIVHVFLNRATLAKAVKFKEFVGDIITSGSAKIIIDLSICEYVDSTFLGAMVALLKKVNSYPYG